MTSVVTHLFMMYVYSSSIKVSLMVVFYVLTQTSPCWKNVRVQWGAYWRGKRLVLFHRITACKIRKGLCGYWGQHFIFLIFCKVLWVLYWTKLTIYAGEQDLKCSRGGSFSVPLMHVGRKERMEGRYRKSTGGRLRRGRAQSGEISRTA